SIQLLGVLLSVSGYRSVTEAGSALSYSTQPESALLTIRMCMGLIPALLVALGLVVMRGWPERNAHNQAATS
ncbi:MAG: MFS transporter, partial [Prochlorococcus sp.]|nr:MFS transporter [Prochlorococcus sp.]